jgi:acid phosphatase (class A)
VIEFERHISELTFKQEIGSFWETNRFPKTEWFFHRVLQDSVWAVDVGKDYWQRPRPYVVLTNLAEGPPERFSGSYPSGHSALAAVCALLLADIFPDKAEAILSKGRAIGRRRVILGRHYPTDIDAGRVLGQRIVQEMRRNRQFRRDFREVKSELRSWAEGNHL